MSAASDRILQRDEARGPTTKTSSVMLRIQFENGSGLVLATARVPALVKCEPAASVPPSSAAKPFHRRARVAERGDGDERAADRPDHRVHRVPHRVHPRHLVGDELDDVEHERRADDQVVVEDAELLRQLTPSRSATRGPESPPSRRG